MRTTPQRRRQSGTSRSCDKARRRQKAGKPIVSIAFWREPRNGFFWINNDYDFTDASWDLGHDVQPSWYYNDGYQRQIDSQRDLEDYARLWICGMPALTNGNFQVSLSWTNVRSGNPTINLFKAAETNGGIGYLTNSGIAASQLAGADNFVFGGPGRAIATISPGHSFTFPASYFTNASNKYFLFDGAITNGFGELMLTITDDSGYVFAQTGVWLDLRDVKDMFEHAHIVNAPSAPPSSTLTDQSSYTNDNVVAVDPHDGKELVVFVHGWRLTPWVAENFAQTMFKRLWWQGYQGRFATLHWPTLSSESDGPAAQYLTFNRDEYIAYKCAQGAANYFTNLQSRFPEYSINVCSHSHGNIIMMEVLKRLLASGQKPIDNYVMMQAAVAAECLDTSYPFYPPLSAGRSQIPDSFYGYAGPIQNAINGHISNFYNTNDFGVVTCWQPDQLLLKPDGRYWYGYFPDGPHQSPPGSSRLITDPQELMSFLSRPNTQAVGAVPNLGGAASTADQVDLSALVGFRGDWTEHSGEFNWNIQRLNPFYKTLAAELGIIPQ